MVKFTKVAKCRLGKFPNVKMQESKSVSQVYPSFQVRMSELSAVSAILLSLGNMGVDATTHAAIPIWPTMDVCSLN